MNSGINVLDNKTELHKEMDKRKRRQQREEELQQRQNRRSSLAIRLKQQAVKLDMVSQTAILAVWFSLTVIDGDCRPIPRRPWPKSS